MENVYDRMWVRDRVVMGLVGEQGTGKGRMKTCFSAGQAVYVNTFRHYFKDIRQVALPVRVPQNGNSSLYNIPNLASRLSVYRLIDTQLLL